MSYTLYTNDVSKHYRDLAENAREKLSILISLTINYESNSKLALKYHNMDVICDNIANNLLSDIDYNDALDNVKAAMNEVNIAQNSYIRDLYVELNGNLSLEP